MKGPEGALRWLVRPLELFFRTETLGGTVLILSTVLALVWANSPWGGQYHALWGTPFTVGAPGLGLSKPMILWINDFLMAIFFLVVGLEVKRELLIGELNTAQRALLPALAAVGGMVVPAALFAVLTREAPQVRGWGIPMATDIAFALGCLRLLGARVPGPLVIMLTALAVIDDLGAIAVIAIGYSTGVSVSALAIAAGLVGVLLVLNRAGVIRVWPYILVGLVLWVAILKSGVHATVAGVLVGLCVPARVPRRPPTVMAEVRQLLDYAEQHRPELQEALSALERRVVGERSPLDRLEHALHPWVAFAIVPLFALANAGVALGGLSAAALASPVPLGVVVGLFVGKPLGIFGFSWVGVRLGWVSLPTGVGWSHLLGTGVLAGIGFTMSLFIAGLAYGEGSVLHEQAKIGILVGSLLSAVAGLTLLARQPAAAPVEAPDLSDGSPREATS